MKKALCIVSLLGGVAMADSQTITKSGELGGFEGNAQNFSGKVKVSMMFKTEPWREMIGALVEFDKNARSAWHTHTAGQTLIVIFLASNASSPCVIEANTVLIVAIPMSEPFPLNENAVILISILPFFS